MSEIIAIIPARAGSKRIPDKNIRDLGGMPLVEHSIISADQCQLIDYTVITSDIDSLEDYEAEYDNLSFIKRPDVLCSDGARDWDVIQHALQGWENSYDLVIYLRPTTPFRSDYHLCEAIKMMLEPAESATGLRSVHKMGQSAFKCFTMPTPWLSPIVDDYVDKTDWPDQEVTPTYHPNGYIDIIRPETLAKGQIWGDWCVGYVTPHTIEIDTPDDWDYAKWYCKRSVEAPQRFGVQRS